MTERRPATAPFLSRDGVVSTWPCLSTIRHAAEDVPSTCVPMSGTRSPNWQDAELLEEQRTRHGACIDLPRRATGSDAARPSPRQGAEAPLSGTPSPEP